MLNDTWGTNVPPPAVTRPVNGRWNPASWSKTENFCTGGTGVPGRDRNLVYEAGELRIHLGRRELRVRGVLVPIGGRAFEIIEVLVQSANELVTKDELMDRVWPGATVGDNTLQVHISEIRKALGQDRAMLKTAFGRGYRLLGSWTPRHQEPRACRSLPRRFANPELLHQTISRRPPHA